MRAVIVAACIASFVTAGSAARQDRPDFSGRWERIEKDAPDSVANLIVVRQTGGNTQPTAGPTVLIARQLVTNLQVERHFGTRVEPARYFVTDTGSALLSGTAGVVSPGVLDQRPLAMTATKWEPAGLAIGTGTYEGLGGPVATERYELWSLAGDGILTITIGERSNGGEMRRTTVTYRRAGQ